MPRHGSTQHYRGRPLWALALALALTVATAAIPRLTRPALAVEVLDQQSLGDDSFAVGSSGTFWQTFTAGVSGPLTKVEVRTGGSSGASLQIRSVDANGNPTGEVLASGSIASSSGIMNIFNWVTVSFTTPTSVTAGTQYAIYIDASCCQMSWVLTGTYAGGRNNWAGTAPYLPGPDTDFLFKTYVYTTFTAPTMTVPTTTAITSTMATLGGTVSGDGGASVTERGVVYAPTATNNNPQIGGAGVTKVAAATGGTGVFTVNVSGLTPNTGYSYAAYAINVVGPSYSSVATFTTLDPSTPRTPSAADSPQPFSYTGVSEAMIVPSGVTSVRITAVGGAGGNSGKPGIGGRGASMQGIFAVTPGEQLTVLAGGAGGSTYYTPGGGGGSFVWRGTDFAAAQSGLLIAAGGGGACWGDNNYPSNGRNASTTTSGVAGDFSFSAGAGGTNGSGGGGGSGEFPFLGSYGPGGGGGGIIGDGGDGHQYKDGTGTLGGGGGRALIHGAGGGAAGATYYAQGGFGGGGGSAYTGGGGGGYSGGGAGGGSYCGGGGGSFNGGVNQQNTISSTGGDGQVVISWSLAVAPTVTSPTATNVTSTAATLGGNVTSDGGATVTERGIVYAPTATNSNPQINGTGVTKMAATAGSTGIFTVDVSGLTPNTGYSYAAYATNSAGTSYSSVATFTTTKTATTTTVTSSANPSVYGQPVTFTATVSPSGATGTVQFQVDGANVGTPVALSGGTATSGAITTLAAGSHTVTAVYGGDTSFAGSTGTLSGGQQVTPAATTTILGSSANPALSGQALTLTAAVAVTVPGAGTPTGSVDFYDGQTKLGSGTLSSASPYQATWQTATLNAGSHTITATYGGDASFSTSTSPALAQVVNQASAITSAASTTFTVGSAGSFTVTDTGYPAPALSLGSGDVLPSGVTFTASTGVLSGTPAAGTGGTYALHLTAGNGVGSDATQTFTLTVQQAPAITSASSTTLTYGSAGSFTVTATGYPTPSLSVTGPLPAGVTFTDTHDGTATLSGTPTAGGSFPLTLTAANGVGQAATQSFTLTVIAADLAVRVTDAPDPVNKGDNISYTISVTNNGPSAASAVSLSNAVPANTTFQALTAPSGWSCTTPVVGGTGTLSCTVASLASGAAANLTLAVQVSKGASSGAIITETVSVTSTTVDPSPANNSATTTTTVVASGGGTTADLSVSATVSPPKGVKVGGSATFTITVKNAGPGTATGVSLTEGLSGVNATITAVKTTQGSCGTPVGGTVSCALGNLPSNASVTVTITATPKAAGTLSGTATVTSDSTDPTPATNTATAAVPVQ